MQNDGEGVGPYSIALQSIAFDAQLRGQANVLPAVGRKVPCVVSSPGAVAEYRFALAAYIPAAARCATGDRAVYREIWDERGTLVFRDPYRRFSGLENAQLPVTVSRAGNYTCAYSGLKGDTRYQCSLVPGHGADGKLTAPVGDQQSSRPGKQHHQGGQPDQAALVTVMGVGEGTTADKGVAEQGHQHEQGQASQLAVIAAQPPPWRWATAATSRPGPPAHAADSIVPIVRG